MFLFSLKNLHDVVLLLYIMNENESLKVTHDVSQTLQRKLEGIILFSAHAFSHTHTYLGLGDVERAFVHVDYEDAHDIATEHKALYEVQEPKQPFVQRVKQVFKKKSGE